ncbi:zinc ribbon domain-containing protein [Chakrabartyella piscis]|uniref:zinc ribbon domain-containing protein n=1 Tax=Chakrabartyella piscis TaxID=2918914 RepID=UPI0029587946|nr:zinc ribbon domain-containing protein [Chakrabartyella piscis]
MKCKYCGYEGDANAKFCGSCGKALETEATVIAKENKIEEIETTEVNEAIEESAIIEMPEEKKKGGISKKVIIVAVVVLIVAVAGVFAKSMVSASPEVVVAKAFLATGDAITTEVDEIKEAMPIVALLEDFATGQYTIAGTYEGYDFGLTVDMAMDNEAGLLQMTPSILGFSGDILISKEYMTLEMPLLDDVYGVNLETLEEDMKARGLLDETSPVGILDTSAEEFLAEQDAAIDGITDIINGVLPEMITICSVEELDAETIEIGDNSIDTDVYGITVNTENLKSILETVCAEILADEAVVTYLNRQLVNYALTEGAYIGDLGITDLQDTVLLEGLFAEIMLGFDSISGNLEAMNFVVNIYNDKIARMYIENSGNTWELQLGVEGKVLECVTSIRTFATGEVLEDTYALVLDGDVIFAEMDLNGEMYSLVYDIAGNNDNFVLNVVDEIITLTVDSTQENAVEIAYEEGYESITILIEKAELADGWFVQKTDFVNALDLTEEEVQSIIMKLLFSGMF